MYDYDAVVSPFDITVFNVGCKLGCSPAQMSRDMRFPTMWHFDKPRLKQANVASFYA